MIRIQLGGTSDPFERLLLDLVEDWDKLERWAIQYSGNPDKIKVAREGKSTIMALITALREETKKAG